MDRYSFPVRLFHSLHLPVRLALSWKFGLDRTLAMPSLREPLKSADERGLHPPSVHPDALACVAAAGCLGGVSASTTDSFKDHGQGFSYPVSRCTTLHRNDSSNRRGQFHQPVLFQNP